MGSGNNGCCSRIVTEVEGLLPFLSFLAPIYHYARNLKMLWLVIIQQLFYCKSSWNPGRNAILYYYFGEVVLFGEAVLNINSKAVHSLP